MLNFKIVFQVLPYIDGRSHVARIAIEADVDIGLVKACIQNLLYYGVVQLIPIFQYSNMYAVTPKLRELPLNYEWRKECITFVAKSGTSQAMLTLMLCTLISFFL